MLSIIKESGPTITGLIVSGRLAAGIGAELGSMRVTEQIDAMEASAVNPFKYLVATRVLAYTAANGAFQLLSVRITFSEGRDYGWTSPFLIA